MNYKSLGSYVYDIPPTGAPLLYQVLPAVFNTIYLGHPAMQQRKQEVYLLNSASLNNANERYFSYRYLSFSYVL